MELSGLVFYVKLLQMQALLGTELQLMLFQHLHFTSELCIGWTLFLL